MHLVSLKYQYLSIVPDYIQPILLLTWSIPCLFLPAFSCSLYHCFYSSWCIFFSYFPSNIHKNPFNYPEQGKEKFKMFEECHAIHIFNVSMCKNTKHNVTGKSCRRERDEKFEFSYTLTKQFLSYFFTFHLDQNKHDAFFKSDVKHHRLWKTKTKTVSNKVRNAEPKNNSETTLCLLKTIHSNSSILIPSSTKIPQKNIKFLHWNFLHYLNMIIKF